MTAAAANRNGEYTVDGPYEHYAVAGSKHIYAYTLVGITAAGYLEPYATATSIKFAGVATEECDNSSGSSGDKSCRVALGGKFKFAKSGTITIANLGEKLVAIDDQTVATGLASASSAMSGANNDVTISAKPAWGGEIGEGISLKLVNPGGASASLGIVVEGTSIIANLATNTASAITTTAALLIAAIEASAAASALISIANKTGDDGTGVVTALAAMNLSLTGPAVGSLAEIDGSDIWARIDAAVAA